ncbi:hypothetical protein [Treponema sp.]|uniref:hypothetical protein n=1 Tax=Treponema sp. TaxID=166 RepID=UPI003FA3080C
MLSLFEEYKNSGKIEEALLVGRNLFNRNPGDEKIFSAYFSYLCTLAETLPSFADRSSFAEQANVALAFYSENAALTSESIKTFFAQRQRINAIFDEIEKKNLESNEKKRREIESFNTDRLKELYALKDALQKVDTQKEFDDILAQIGNLDSKIDKDALTDEQSSVYGSLTKDHTEFISMKMRQLEYKKNIAYNRQAVDEFALAFKQFNKNEKQYKDKTQLFHLASTKLFAFDASRLFNETLIYFNHVYSYIFSKLDDDGKLALTRYSVECERNRGGCNLC